MERKAVIIMGADTGNNNKSTTLAEAAPLLAEEWHPKKNGQLTPKDITKGSHQKVWWLGKCGHEWDASVRERVRGYGCPICAGKRVLAGYNDLATMFPEIANQWHPTKNGELTSDQVVAKSHKKIWWICDKGHEWESPIDNRTRGRGCPVCTGKRVVSGFNDFASHYSFLTSEWNYERNGDLYPTDVTSKSKRKVWWRCSLCGHEWEAGIYSRVAGNGCPKCARRLQSSFPEQALFFYIKQYFHDAVNGYRDEAFDRSTELDIYIPSRKIGIEYDGKHWHNSKETRTREINKYKKCGELGISLIRVRESSSLLDYEICDELINAKNDLGETICDVLSSVGININTDKIDVEQDRYSIYAGYVNQLKSNNLKVAFPEIAKEWHPTKNHGLVPEMFTPRNDAKVWWKCPKGHEYMSTIAHRTEGSNCPYCSNRKLLRGFNDFATTNDNPLLMEEWDYEENEKRGIFPDSFTKGSKKKVCWMCAKGHKWRTTISERNRGSGCPVCSGRLVDVGINDLKTLRPKLLKEWDYQKNKDVDPAKVSVFSNKKVWWRCGEGHEWEAIIQVRSRGAGCPICAQRNKMNTAKFRALMSEINPSIEIVGEYVNTETKVECHCKICGKTWYTTPHTLKSGHGCPGCARNGSRMTIGHENTTECP